LVGLGTLAASSDLQDQTPNHLEGIMPSRNEHLRDQARARLERETPIADDATLLSLQKHVDAIINEAKRRDPTSNAEAMSTVIDEIRRTYFRQVRRR